MRINSQSPGIVDLLRGQAAELFQRLRSKPLLWVFAVLLVVFTLIGSSRVSASGQEALTQTSPSPSPTTFAIQAAQIYVHLVGAVERPGLYRLDSGARLADAIALAHGFGKNAEASSVNLARILTDGEQISVQTKGEFKAMGGSVGGNLAVGNPGASAAANALVSLNRADQGLLETLPRVGPALAGRIIDWRSANGGFKTKDDLLKVSGFGAKMFAAVKDLITL